MKIYRYIIAVSAIFALLSLSAFAAHFEYTGGSNENISISTSGLPGETITPTIGGEPLASGDGIGVFAWRGGAWSDCFGGTDYNGAGSMFAVTTYGHQHPEYSLPEMPGFNDNEEVHVHIYDASTGTTYTNVEVEAYIAFTGPPVVSWDGKYLPNRTLIILTKMNAIAPPRAPKNLMPVDGTVGIATSGNLTWEDISDYADTYDVQLSTDGVSANVVNQTGLSTNSYAYSGLTNGSYYWWRVRGVHNSEGAGTWSAWQKVQVALETPTLSSPTNMSTGFAIDGSLAWNAVNGATAYEWEVFSDAALTTSVASGSAASTSVTNTANAWGLMNGTDYWWRVRATNGANISAYTPAWKFQVQIGAPTLLTPADLATTVAHPVMFDWSNVSGAVSYEIEIAEDNTFTIVDHSATPAGSNYSASNLDSWTTYYWRARGKDANGNFGTWSTVFTFMTDLTAPMNPMPANLATGIDLSGNLTWDAVNGADDYVITLATDAALTSVLAGWPKTTASNSVAYTVPDFETRYYWNVKARNAQSDATSSTWRFESRLDSPTLLTPANASACNDVSLILDWADFGIVPANGDYYRLQLSTNAAFSSFVGGYNGSSQITVSQQAISGLAHNTTYYWRVEAYKNGQFSGYSPAFMFTTENDVVTQLMPTDYTNGTATNNLNLSWTAIPAATTYTVELDDNPSFASPTTYTTGATSQMVGSLSNNSVYYWRVYSDACGADVAADATVRQFRTLLAAPTLLSPANGAIDQPLSGTLSWNSVPGADTYEVWMSTDPNFASNVHIMAEATGTSYNYMGIDHNTTHYWKVRGYNSSYGAPAIAGAPGQWSSTYSLKTVTLGPPQLTTPSNGFVGTLFSVDLFWNTFPNAVSYNIQASTDPTFADPGQMLLDINTTIQTAQVTGLGYNTTVYWRAQTVTASGTSNWGLPFSFTTIPAPTISGPADVCEGTSHLYSVNVNPSIAYTIDYTWSVTNATIIGDDDKEIVDIEFNTPGTAVVKVVRSSANWGAYTDSYTYTVNTNATVDLNTTIDLSTYYQGTVCVQEPVTFTADEDLPVALYEWVWIDGMTETVLSTNSSFVHRFPAVGTYMIELRTYDASICGEGVTSMMVTVDDTCPVFAEADDIETCRGANATFDTEVWGGDGNYTFTWHPDNNLINKYTATPTIPNVQSSANYQFIVQDGSSNTATDVSHVTLKQGPTITTKRTWIIGLADITIDLTTQILTRNGVAPYPNPSDEWYYYSGGSKVSVNPTAEPTVFGFRRYYVEFTDATGCTSYPAAVNVFRRRSKEIPQDAYTFGLNGSSVMAAYPNPVTDKLTVTAEFLDEVSATVKIVDITGNEIVLDKFSGVKLYNRVLDVSGLSAGVYMVVIESSQDKVIQKIVKQ